jgi:hypothetical protein
VRSSFGRWRRTSVASCANEPCELLTPAILSAVRVTADELDRIASDVAAAGRRYGGDDLSGAIMDCDYALYDGGFTTIDFSRTGELRPMVIYTCRPESEPESNDDVIEWLEKVWLGRGTFRTEVHAISVKESRLVFDFVTRWDDHHFYNGSIEVELSGQLHSEE